MIGIAVIGTGEVGNVHACHSPNFSGIVVPRKAGDRADYGYARSAQCAACWAGLCQTTIREDAIVPLPSVTDIRNRSGVRTEENIMFAIVLSIRAEKLLRLLELEGYENLEGLIKAALLDSVCPGICMTEGCNHSVEVEPDQAEGHCEVCGGNTVVSGLVLAGVI